MPEQSSVENAGNVRLLVVKYQADVGKICNQIFEKTDRFIALIDASFRL